MAEELPHNISDREIRDAFNEKLEHIAAKDPNPYNQRAATDELQRRRTSKSPAAPGFQEIESKPFDPRTEISADAKHIAGRIVGHMWAIVLIPAALWLIAQMVQNYNGGVR
jgi:hypothetical protein